MYFEEARRNVMSLLRQLGCPSIFLTLSSAEFDWPELLQEVAETGYRRKFTIEEINSLSNREKNRLISQNVVITTLHFNRKFQKLFTLMKHNFFGVEGNQYKVSSFFFRIEFQMRGSPHVHSLLWLKDMKGTDAPAFWSKEEGKNKK